jgi:hypothetical protein
MFSLFLSGVMLMAQPPSRTPEGQALYELFSGQDCALDCFMGIRPNMTTQQEFTSWLDRQQLAYETPEHAPEEIYWSIPPSTFIPYNRLRAFVLNGYIRQISGRIYVPINVILEVFGAPSSMTFDLSTNQNADQALIIYIFYPEYGLGFKLHKTSFPDVRTTSFVLTFPEDPYGWATYPLGTPMTDACSNYNVWPCIIPTATPTPTPTPTAQPPPPACATDLRAVAAALGE